MIKNLYLMPAISTLILIIWGCSPVEDDSLLKTTVPSTYQLGDGIDMERPGFQEKCVSGTIETINQPRMSWDFQSIRDYSMAASSLGIDTDINFAYGLAKFDSKASFAMDTKETALSSNFFLNAEYILGEKKLKNAKINQVGLDAAVPRFTCGTNYINSVVYGGRFLALVKFTFNSKEAKNKAGFQLGIDYVGTTVNTNINRLSENEKQNSRVTISIKSLGGSVQNPIFGDAKITECNLNNWAACRNFIEQLITYSKDTFPKSLTANNHNLGFSSLPLPTQGQTKAIPAAFQKQRETVIQKTFETLQDIERLQVEAANPQIAPQRRNSLLTEVGKLDLTKKKLFQWITRCLPKLDNSDGTCAPVGTMNLYKINERILGDDNVWTFSAYVGGNGGGWFEAGCNNFIKGIYGTAGTIFDQVGLECDNNSQTEKFGAHAGTPIQKLCPNDTVVTGFKGVGRKFWLKNLIGGFTIICSNPLLATPQESDVRVMGGAPDEKFLTFRCPKGWAASKIQGNSGKYVDRIRMACRRAN